MGASDNVFINLANITNQDYKIEVRKEMEHLVSEAKIRCHEVLDVLQAKM